jgi:predicted nuclease of predicted toxin-antitoxin system
MASFLLDEDVPSAVGQTLADAGHNIAEVRSTALRGKTDEEVLAYAKAGNAILVTRDLGFANELRFPANAHRGILLLRFPPQMRAAALAAEIASLIVTLTDMDLYGNLTILEPNRVRQRRRRTPEV